jgi:septal ring factor EnvC (AmiA/AmiB activator)
MSEVKTVTPEELQEVKELQDAYVTVTYDLGQSNIDKNEAEKTIERSNSAIQEAFTRLDSLKLKEKEISDKLIEKYGSSTIDLSTGNIL